MLNHEAQDENQEEKAQRVNSLSSQPCAPLKLNSNMSKGLEESSTSSESRVISRLKSSVATEEFKSF